MRIFIFAILITSSFNAFADTVEVVFFGGHASSPEQMRCWEKGARAESSRQHDYNFRGVAYPAGAHYSRQAALSGSRAEVQRLVNEINANPNKRYVIAGHSSGAAISNQVASLVKNPRQIDLINLDGFAPSRELQDRVGSSKCWYAVNPGSGGTSLNAGSMRGCRNSAKVTSATCRTSMCLHFAMVNSGAPATLSNYRKDGYNSCRTNLEWLRALENTSAAAPRRSTGPRASSVR